AVNYAITLPGFGRPEKFAKDELPQHAAIDVGYDMSGVMAEWERKEEKRSVWLPHLGSKVAQPFTGSSGEHEEFWNAVHWRNKDQIRSLTFNTQLNMWQMLRPAVQEGAKVDYALPEEDIHFWVRTYQSHVVAKLPAGLEKPHAVLGALGGPGAISFRFRPKE